jgi:hypothetical protein
MLHKPSLVKFHRPGARRQHQNWAEKLQFVISTQRAFETLGSRVSEKVRGN